MGELKTISDSKQVFYKEFPYVIPHVFRRIADEILVELNLLSHQRDFKTDALFSLGLTKAFRELTSGYKPKEHIEKLFNALCNCNNIDPAKINQIAETANRAINTQNTEGLKAFIDEKEINNKELTNILKLENNIYSRLSAIGILDIVTQIVNKESTNNTSTVKELTNGISSVIGYSTEKVERDLNIYLSGVDKLKQSLELIEMLNKKRRSA